MAPNRHVNHCLLCGKADASLTAHLKLRCMKGRSDAERKEEMQRAKDSNKMWNYTARTWYYKDICQLITNDVEKSRRSLVRHLRENGFFVPDYYEDEQPTTSTSTAPQPVASQTSVLPAANASTEICPGNAEEDIGKEDTSSEPSDSDPAGEQGTTSGASQPPSSENNLDPTWQK